MGRLVMTMALLLAAAPAWAQQQTGPDPLSALYLESACEKTIARPRDLSEGIQSGFCFGTILGAVHMHNYLAIELKRSPPLFCEPADRATAEQWVRIFLAYAQNNPAQLHLNRIVVLSQAFAEAFPCPNG